MSKSGWFPPPSRPIAADGLRARSARGSIAKTWWSQRFIEVLEGIGLGSRMQRGRRYARQGQVLSLAVGTGQVHAEVQGSRAKPYRVRIGIAAFGKPDWLQVERLLVENSWYAAALLSGEMPQDIEEVFVAAGLSLFPASADDMSLDCSCPDWEVPCKHLAAVFYLLAESFDEDPFMVLAWRGRGREELLNNLAAARSQAAAVDTDQGWRPLGDFLDSFYDMQGDPAVSGRAVAVPTAVIDQLPDVDVEVRGRNLAELLRPAYLVMTQGEH